MLGLSAQSKSAKRDTVSYKVGYYDIKKQTKVFLVAEKLHVNPQIIVTLNKFRSVEQNLYKDQRIKIPVYPRGYKYEPEKDVAPVSVPPSVIQQMNVQPGKDTSSEDDEPTPLRPDIDQIRTEREYIPSKPNQEVVEAPTKEVEPQQLDTAVSIPMEAITSDTAPPISIVETVSASENPSEDSSALELLDVMMELNDAILAGTLASLDSIDAIDSTDLNEGNVEDVMRRLRKARNRVLLRPELLTIRDSLVADIALQKAERIQIVSRLEAYNKQVEQKKADEARKLEEQKRLLAEAQVVPTVKSKETRKTAKFDDPLMPGGDDVKEKEKKRKPELTPLDTVIVIDLEPWKVKKAEQSVFYESHPEFITPAFENTKEQKNTTTIVAVKDTIAAVPASVEKFESDTDYFAQIREATRIADSLANPELYRQSSSTTAPNVVISGTVKRQPGGGENAKIVPHFASTVQEQNYRQYYSSNTPEYLIPVDTVRKVKAEFFLRRAEKSLEEKNFKNTQQYLKKSLELNPNYFDAWLMTADLEAMYGSQTKALKDYTICSQIDSTQHRLWYKMATLYQQIKRKKDALEAYSKAIEIIPTDVLSRMGRAAINSDFKQYERSLEDYNYITTINPAYAYVYKARGIVYHLNKNFEQAIEEFDKYLTLEKKPDGSVYYYRGLSKIATNRLLDGCLDLSKASGYGYKAADRAIAKSCE
jgi:tetratricopeptide (TPR) repeat protein